MRRAVISKHTPRLTPKRIWEMFEETDRRFKETDKKFEELGKYIKQLSKNIGGLNESMDKLIETLIAARLWELFAAYPYNLKQASRRVLVHDHTGTVLTDIDILLSNGEYAMAVEVKRDLNQITDVDIHERRMERIQAYPPDEVKGKKLLGALAGGAVDPEVREYAYEKGFFVLELSGKNVTLLPVPEGFSPTEWG